MPSHTISTLAEKVVLVFSGECRRIMQTLWCCLERAFNENASGGAAFIKALPSSLKKNNQRALLEIHVREILQDLTHLVKFAEFAYGSGGVGRVGKKGMVPHLLVLCNHNLIRTFIVSLIFFQRGPSFAIILWKLNIIDAYPGLQEENFEPLLPPATWQKSLIHSSQHDEQK